ncbi:hypothetical protein [Cecembia rubra]|uniref:ATP-dependent serine protease n=1 Tax=Cecembia rubra TaxID=1485585 RepID=A0A2P8EAS1_9BACT|nr:hypothetical protein [Cecembia rubra]PSL06569.1 hypothetical protein CLV48_102386 [Cecembia rubra]
MAGERIKRALSVNDILSKQYELIEFEGEWYQAFSKPENRGVWFIWGNSGNGKTSFVLQMIKELSKYFRIVFNSLEEGDGHTIQNAFIREGMNEAAKKLIITSESMSDLGKRLGKRKSPEVAVIDSYQYTEMSFKDYLRFKNKHPDKLLIFISQADGKRPMGRAAVSVMYDASLKIWIEGYRAFSKGRYIGPNGGTYTIFEEGAALYHGN